MSKPIPWEQISPDGEVAVLYQFKQLLHAASPLKDTAIQKLTEVAAISAAFQGESILYLPRFWILFDYDDSNVEFYGAYLPEEPDGMLPDLCLRKGSWKRNHDREQVKHHQDYDKYVWSAKHASVFTFFTQVERFPQIRKLIHEFGDYLTTRMHLKPSATLRTPADYSYLAVKFYDEDFMLNLEYCPLYRREVLLEERAEVWKNCFLEVTFEASIIPDKGSCKLNYSPSVMERLAVYTTSN